MPKKAKDLAAQADRIARAWEEFCPDKTFSSLTLKEFRDALQPCRDVRKELAKLAKATKLARYRRIAVDTIGRPVLLRVIHAVRGDAELGEDSAMYAAMGYTAKGRRRKPGPKKKASSSPPA